MDKGLMVKFANESRLQVSAPIEDFANMVFEAGRKYGVYQALRQADSSWTNLDECGVHSLSASIGDLLTRIVHRINEIKSLHVSMVEERLALAIVGRCAAEEHLAEAKEALKRADICEKVANGEVAVLEQMLKEIKLWKRHACTSLPIPCSRTS